MIVRCSVILLLLALLAPLSWCLDADKADLATVLIVLYGKDGEPLGTGSGFFVTADGHILTNAHVVENVEADQIRIYGRSLPEKGKAARKVWVIPEHDTAVLKSEKPAAAKPLLLLNVEPNKGSDVWALGYPGKQLQNMTIFGESFDEFDATLTDGIVSRVFKGSAPGVGVKYPIVQHTAAISPGNSGGPLLNSCGIVVGINTATTTGADGIDDTDFFAIASSGLLRLLSPRILGIESSNDCVTELVKETEVEVITNEIVDQTTHQPSGKSAKNQPIELRNQSIKWLLLALALLAIGLFYFRKNSPQLELARYAVTPPQPDNDLPKRQDDNNIIRLSGFDSKGSPTSFVIDAKSEKSEKGIIIGREAEFTDFTISSSEISRAHAQIKFNGKNWEIRDLGTSNGTIVNDLKLSAFNYVKIKLGDEICLASCTLSVTT